MSNEAGRCSWQRVPHGRQEGRDWHGHLLLFPGRYELRLAGNATRRRATNVTAGSTLRVLLF